MIINPYQILGVEQDATLEEIRSKDCPKDRTVYTVSKDTIPSDRSFREAWTYTE